MARGEHWSKSDLLNSPKPPIYQAPSPSGSKLPVENQESKSEDNTLQKVFNISKILANYKKMKIDDKAFKNFTHTSDDLRSISTDSDRTFHFVRPSLQQKHRSILKEVLTKTRIPYFQGMADVSAYIVYHMLSHTPVEESGSVSVIDLSERDVGEMALVLEKVLYKKVLPLVENDFKKYKEMNKITIKMLRKRDNLIGRQESMMYVSNILTFFTRDCATLDETYFLLSVILASPNNIPFLILVMFFPKIQKKQLLTCDDLANDKKFLKKLILLEEEYLKLEAETEQVSKKGMGSSIILAGGIVVGAMAAGLFYLNKKK